MEGDVGLVAGRSQREKRRSYKDLLREEEEIAAQVRKSAKKRPKVKGVGFTIIFCLFFPLSVLSLFPISAFFLPFPIILPLWMLCFTTAVS